MKILIICSKSFYDKIEKIKLKLEDNGNEVILPSSYDNINAENESWDLGYYEHSKYKQKMFKLSEEKVKSIDAVLTLNFDKNGIKNYIGGSTFLELYEAFKNNKKIYLYNEIPKGILYDEISGFSPVILNGDLKLIKKN